MKTLVTPGVRPKIAPPPFPPYDWQQPIIKDMVQTIVEGKSGLVIQPTATGKSVEAAFTARACILLHKMKGLYLYNENEGLAQARKKFQQIFAGNGIKCASYFGYGKDDFVHESDMVFASFQSLNSQYGKWYMNFAKDHFDFVIVNEAHHSQADTYREVIKYFECGKIGMTATEKRADGRDIRDLFPHIICEIYLEEAIARGWVAKLHYLVKSSGLSTQRLKKICDGMIEDGKRISIKQLNENIFVEKLDRQMLKEIYEYSFPSDDMPRQTLLFCENINHAKHMLKLLLEDQKLAGTVHSKQSDGKNRETMDAFRTGQIQFLISIDKLNEDIDVPEAEVGVFIRATDSETVFFQQLGRLLRLSGKKKMAYVLDFVANLDRIIMVQEIKMRVKEKAKQFGQDILEDSLMHISGEGFEFSFSEELRDILQVLQLIRQGFYSTWQEAGAAAKEIGISSLAEYSLLYKKDLRLPSTPNDYYANFPNWYEFLGKEKPLFYGTWQEASEAAKRLGVIYGREYIEKYKGDSYLPSSPHSFYEDFPGWEKFLGTDPYPTWQEASEAAKRLGIKSNRDYRRKYEEDVRLRASPEKFYSDFPGFPVFLGNTTKNNSSKNLAYPTWREAADAAKKIGVKTREDYRLKYKEDKKLYGSPDKFYSDFPGWKEFLNVINQNTLI